MIKLANLMKCTRIIFVALMVLLPFSVSAEPQGKLIIFHAGSLTVPFTKIEKDFEAKYSKVDVLREGGGSTKMARMISELHKPADIMASADFNVIDKTLIPEYAVWNIRFATNQLVLCYTDKSRFANQITANNWHTILKRKGVIWGQADPNLDPCGYRSLMLLQLAEKYYLWIALPRFLNSSPFNRTNRQSATLHFLPEHYGCSHLPELRNNRRHSGLQLI